jgi:hypothetical protein
MVCPFSSETDALSELRSEMQCEGAGGRRGVGVREVGEARERGEEGERGEKGGGHDSVYFIFFYFS